MKTLWDEIFSEDEKRYYTLQARHSLTDEEWNEFCSLEEKLFDTDGKKRTDLS